jgi:phage terminase small subunit
LSELTPKQERFIQNIVSGMSQREAYKEAYNAENMKDETIDTEACKLFNDHKISTRYKELIEELKNKAIMTAQERMIWLTEVIKDVQKEKVLVEDIEISKTADLNTKMKALDILNKMSGEYTTKIEADIDTVIRVDIDE